MFCFGRRAERQQSEGSQPPTVPVRAAPTAARTPAEDVISDISSDGKYEVDIPTPKEFTLANVQNIRFIDCDKQDGDSLDEGQDPIGDRNEDDGSITDPHEVFLSGENRLPPPLEGDSIASKYLSDRFPINSVSSSSASETLNSPRIVENDGPNGRASAASTADIGRHFSSSSSQNSSIESTDALGIANLMEASPTQGRSAAPGPRFKLLHEGDIQVCRLNHSRTVISKILSNKFLRRWENHHLYLNDNCISSKTPLGFLESPCMYSSMDEIYSVVRWDTNQKFCLRIVLNDGSLLLQAKNAYTRDQWYHSILWKRNLYKYRNVLYGSLSTNVLIKELKSLVDYVMVTPLQDESVTTGPLEIISTLLSDENYSADRSEAIVIACGPIMSVSTLPESLAIALRQMCQTQTLSPQIITILHHVARRILKHNVDFGKATHLRRFLQDFISALYHSHDGAELVRAWIGTVHGPGFNCPHPRVLPNLIAACLAAFHSLSPPNEKESDDLLTDLSVNIKYECNFTDLDDNPSLEQKDNDVIPVDSAVKLLKDESSSKSDKYFSSSKLKNTISVHDEDDMVCYASVIMYMSSYADWAEGLGSLLQSVPIPTHVFQSVNAANSLAIAAVNLGTDRRCAVHRHVLPMRQGRPGWLQLISPSRLNPDPDRLHKWGEILDTLLNCCCKRKCFLIELAKMLPACLLLALRAHQAGLESLCLMLEWEVLDDEQARVEAVQALRSTPPGKRALQASCQRQVHLKKLQQKGGPRRLTLPSCATDADVARLLSAGSFGNLECLSLAFTHVTSAVAEQLIKLPSLRYLNLWATQFGDAGVLLIVEHLHRLQVLNLCETPVSDVGIAALAALSGLRKLNLNSTKLSAATWARLRPMLPALQECDVRYTDAW